MELTINKWFIQYKYIKINDNLQALNKSLFWKHFSIN